MPRRRANVQWYPPLRRVAETRENAHDGDAKLTAPLPRADVLALVRRGSPLRSKRRGFDTETLLARGLLMLFYACSFGGTVWSDDLARLFHPSDYADHLFRVLHECKTAIVTFLVWNYTTQRNRTAFQPDRGRIRDDVVRPELYRFLRAERDRLVLQAVGPRPALQEGQLERTARAVQRLLRANKKDRRALCFQLFEVEAWQTRAALQRKDFIPTAKLRDWVFDMLVAAAGQYTVNNVRMWGFLMWFKWRHDVSRHSVPPKPEDPFNARGYNRHRDLGHWTPQVDHIVRSVSGTCWNGAQPPPLGKTFRLCSLFSPLLLLQIEVCVFSRAVFYVCVRTRCVPSSALLKVLRDFLNGPYNSMTVYRFVNLSKHTRVYRELFPRTNLPTSWEDWTTAAQRVFRDGQPLVAFNARVREDLPDLADHAPADLLRQRTSAVLEHFDTIVVDRWRNRHGHNLRNVMPHDVYWLEQFRAFLGEVYGFVATRVPARRNV